MKMCMSYAEFVKYTLTHGPTWKGGVSFNKWYRSSLLWRRGALAAWLISSSAFALNNLTHSAVPNKGNITPNFTRATKKRIPDHEGTLRTLIAGELGFPGARRVQNLFTQTENFTHADWTKSNGSFSGNVFTASAGGGSFYQSKAVTIGTWLVWAKLSCASGTVAAGLFANGVPVAPNPTTSTIIVTTTPTKFALPITITSAGTINAGISPYNPIASGSSVTVHEIQLEDITGRTDQTTPSEYVSVGAVQRNYVFYSNNPVYWSVASNVTATPNQLANPVNGALDAWKVAATAAAATNLNTTLGVTALATEATASFYAHKGSGATDANKFALYNDSTASILSLVSIDYDTGVLTTLVGVAGTSTNAGNGWWRISLSATSGITVGNQLRVYACFPGNAETAGEYAYLYGTQGEFESAATSYQDVGNVPAYHGSMVDGVKCFPTDLDGTPLPTRATYEAVIHKTNNPMTTPLIELAATNILLQSNSFTTTWVAVGTPAATQNVVGPDGATSAWTMTDNDAGASEGVAQVSLTLTAATWTGSIFVKKTTGAQTAYPVIFIQDAVVGRAAICTIDTSNGIATVWTAYTGYTIQTSVARCSSFNDSFWRVELAFTATATADWRYYIYPAGTANATQSTGILDVTAQGSAVVYGAQLELGTAVTSYIPTTTAAATRNADQLYYTGADIANIKTLAAIGFKRESGFSDVGVIAALSDGTVANYRQSYLNGATQLVFDSSAGQWNIVASNAYAPGTLSNDAFSTATNDIKASKDGVTQTADTSATIPAVTRLEYGMIAGAYQLNGHPGIPYGWDWNLSQAELNAITLWAQ